MAWTEVVWHEAGNYGLAGAFQPQRDMGRLTFPTAPEVGMVLEINGEDFLVVESNVPGIGYVHVRPMRMRPIG